MGDYIYLLQSGNNFGGGVEKNLFYRYKAEWDVTDLKRAGMIVVPTTFHNIEYDNDPATLNPQVFSDYVYLDYNDFTLQDNRHLVVKKEDSALTDLKRGYIRNWANLADYSESTIL